MTLELNNNQLYKNFRPYSYYKVQNPIEKNSRKNNLKPLIGSALGVALGLGLNYKIFGKIEGREQKFIDFIKSEEELPIAQEAAKLINMAALANIGGVLGGSIGQDKTKIPKKIKEALFQIMNMAIPMVLVSSFIALTKKVGALSKLPIKISGSFAAMITGAILATGINNLTLPKGEPKRKYTIKDSVANFDDIVATIKLGFHDITKIIPVHYILPFIYTYCGMRAGAKED